MMDDDDQLSIDTLPDEILLNIFRMLSAKEFVVYMPLVCEKWSQIIASDSCTLQQIGMYHENLTGTVEFFYFWDERKRSEMFHWPIDDFVQLLLQASKENLKSWPVIYEDVSYACTRYAEIYKHIATLVISSSLSVYATQGFTYVDRLTMLVFHGVRFREQDQYTLAELGTVYANVLDVIYVKCSVDSRFDLKFLHSGFRCLRRFRADHYSLNIHFLEYMLHTHRQTLETVELRDCKVTGDQWINVLSQKLRGRTINRLTMLSPYFTAKRVKQFMTTADLVLPDDKSNVIIDNIQIGSRIEFFINIDPIII